MVLGFLRRGRARGAKHGHGEPAENKLKDEHEAPFGLELNPLFTSGDAYAPHAQLQLGFSTSELLRVRSVQHQQIESSGHLAHLYALLSMASCSDVDEQRLPAFVEEEYAGDVQAALSDLRRLCTGMVNTLKQKAVLDHGDLAEASALIHTGDRELCRSMVSVLLEKARSAALVKTDVLCALAWTLGRLPKGTLGSADFDVLVEFCMGHLEQLRRADVGEGTSLARLELVAAAFDALDGDRGPAESTWALSFDKRVRPVTELLEEALSRSTKHGATHWRAEAAALAALQAVAHAKSDFDRFGDVVRRAAAAGRVLQRLYSAGRVVLQGVASFGATAIVDLLLLAREYATGDATAALREMWSDVKAVAAKDGPRKTAPWYAQARLLAALAAGGGLGEMSSLLADDSGSGILQQAAASRPIALALAAALVRIVECSSWEQGTPGINGEVAVGWLLDLARGAAALTERRGEGALSVAVAALATVAGTEGVDAAASAALASLRLLSKLGGAGADARPPARRFPVALPRLSSAAGARGAGAELLRAAKALAWPPPDPLCTYAQSEVASTRDALSLYVPPRATTDPSQREVVDLLEYTAGFIRRTAGDPGGHGQPPAGQSVLLITGDPGSSKSTFLKFLHREACRQLQRQAQACAGSPLPAVATVCVRLASLGSGGACGGLRRVVAEQLGLSPVELPFVRDRRGLVLLLDAYDELDADVNLWIANELEKWASAAVITCRSTYVASKFKRSQEIFAPDPVNARRLAEVRMHLFGPEQVAEYLEQYVRLHGSETGCGWTAQDYQRHIAATPGVSQLVENPFTLSLVARLLPAVVEERERGKGGQAADLLTSVELYRRFVDDWLRSQWTKKISSSAGGARSRPDAAASWESEDFVEWAKDLCRELAVNMYRAGISEVVYGAPRRAPRRGEQAPAAVAAPPTGHVGRCVELIEGSKDSLDKFVADSCGLLVLSRGAGDGDGTKHVRFLHKTLMEFFVVDDDYSAFVRALRATSGLVELDISSSFRASRRGSLSVSSGADAREADSAADDLLSVKLLTSEPKILHFLAEQCAADLEFRQRLLRLVEASRTDGSVVAAANALTILNYAGQSFAGCDLRGIRVPGAGLQRVEAAGADLRGADLTGCNLDRANLAGTDLRGTTLSGCDVAANPALLGHEGDVVSVAITAANKWPSPPCAPLRDRPLALCRTDHEALQDGRRAVSCGGDRALRVWDLELGSEVARLPQSKAEEKWEVSPFSAVAVTADGALAVSGSWDMTVRAWDLRSNAEIHRLLGHEGPINCVAVTPNGGFALTGSDDETVRLWDLATGIEKQRLRGHEDKVTSVAITADGKFAVTGSEDQTVRVWDLEQGKETLSLRGHTRGITSVSVTADGTRAASGSRDKTLRVWDLKKGSELMILKGHEGAVLSVSITADGRRCVSGSADRTVRWWDVDKGGELRQLQGHEERVLSVAVTPDGRRAVSGGYDRAVLMWDLDACGGAGGEPLRAPGHDDCVNAVALAQDGRRAVSGGRDRALCVWDVERGSQLLRLKGHDDWVFSVALTVDGRRAVSGGRDKAVRLWDLETGAELLTLKGHEHWIDAVAVTDDGKRAVSGSRDKSIRIWDLERGLELRSLLGHESTVNSVAIARDGRRCVSGSWDRTVALWDLEKGARLLCLQGHTRGVKSVAISADGRLAVSGSIDKTVRVWDLERGAELHTLEGHGETVFAVALTADGKKIISGSRDRTVRVWDSETGAELNVLRGHDAPVVALGVTPDGRRAVSGSWDKTLRVHDFEAPPSDAPAPASRAPHGAICPRRMAHTEAIRFEATGAKFDSTTSLSPLLAVLLRQLGATSVETCTSEATIAAGSAAPVCSQIRTYDWCSWRESRTRSS
eukprot:tig00000334_g24114.t2